MRTIAIIQARLGSTRLPRKILLPILGHSMLQHLVERVRRSKRVADVVVACPMEDIKEIGHEVDCTVYANVDVREDDLVHRYFDAGRAFHAEAVVRIPSDNPCVDAENVDLVVSTFAKNKPNKLYTNLGDAPKSKWPQGLGAEVYDMNLLCWLNDRVEDPFNQRASAEARTQAAKYREHPHKFFHEVAEFVEPECLHSWTPPLRFDVNTEADFYFIEKLYKHFGSNTFTTAEVLEYAHGSQRRSS